MNTATKPRLMLEGRILYRDRDGQVSDVTHRELFGLEKFAENGSLVLRILADCRKRLDLLFMATEGRTHLDADLVRLTVRDLQAELRDGCEVDGYVRLTQELFENSKPLTPETSVGTSRTDLEN
ncbi:MAG: hypothetical protein U0223_12865 [Nitrospira sp.]|nr:hypothetical protein [Nitrospira sp.]